MVKNNSKAQGILLFIIVVTLLTTAFFAVMTFKPASVGRLALYSFFCWFLYQGRNWARYWLMVLYFIGAGFVLYFLFNASLLNKSGSTEGTIVLVCLGVFYGFAFYMLGFSKTVAAYFEDKAKHKNALK